MSKSVVTLAALCVAAGLLAACVAERPVATDFDRPSVDKPTNSPARRSAKLHVDLGTAYMQSGRNGVALDEARAAIASDDSYAPGHLLMGMVYAEQEQYALAYPGFEQAYRLAPGDPEVANAYGWFLCSQGREAEGLPRLEQAARNPYYATPTRAWMNAGVCLLRKKDVAGAEDRFMRALQADPENVAVLLYLANLAYQSDRNLLAKQRMDQAQKLIEQTTPELLWLAARIEHRLGNRSSVNDFGARLRKEFPGSREYQLYLQGKFE